MAQFTVVNVFPQTHSDESNQDSEPSIGVNPANPQQGAAVIKFFDWGFSHGNDIAAQLQYIPLPPAVQDAVRKAWQTGMKPNG